MKMYTFPFIMMVKFVTSAIPVQSYVHLKFTLWKQCMVVRGMLQTPEISTQFKKSLPTPGLQCNTDYFKL